MHDPTPPQSEHEHQTLDQQQDAPPADTSGQSTGDDVMNILADVEQKFDKLRAVQKSHEQELTSLNDRRAALDEAELELDQELSKLVDQQNELDQQRRSMDEQREQLKGQQETIAGQQQELLEQREHLEQLEKSLREQREQLDQQTAAAQQAGAEFDEQRQQWEQQRKTVDEELLAQREAIEQRRNELKQQEQNHQHTTETLQQLEQELNEQQSQFDAQRQQWEQQRTETEQQLDARNEGLAERAAQLDELQRDLEQQQQQVATLNEQVQQKQQALDARQRDLDAELEELRKQAEAAQQSQQQAMQELESQSRQMAEAEQRAQQLEHDLREATEQGQTAQSNVDELNSRVEELTNRASQQEQTLNESEQRLATAGEKLRHFAEILNEQAPQLERGASALAMVEEQRQKIEKLNMQLAEAKRAGNPEELQRRDRRIAELTEALQQARGQIGVDHDASELQIQIAELSKRNDQLVADLEQAQLAADQAREELKQLESRSAEASSADHRHVVDALKAEHAHELESLRGAHNQGMQEYRTKRDTQVRSMQEQLSKLQDSLIEAKQQAAGSGATGESVKAFQTRIAELEVELEKARANNPQQTDEKLRRKVKRINAAANHLSRRRKRLKTARKLMTARQQQIAQKIAASHHNGTSATREELQRQVRAIEQQRRELTEVREFLANSEKELMSRWARPRAIASVGWLVFLTIFAGVASYFGTQYIAPTPVTAVVSFAPQPENPMEFSTEQAVAWQRWHAEYLLSPDFQKALARRCADRNLEPYGNVDELSARLSADLNLDMSEPKKITASLQGFNDDQTKLLLDILATTLALESSRQLDRGNDTARATPLGERKEDGRVAYANLLPAPGIVEQIKTSAPIFGGIMGGLIVLMIIIYFTLARSKRVFESESAVFGAGADDGELLAM